MHIKATKVITAYDIFLQYCETVKKKTQNKELGLIHTFMYMNANNIVMCI